MDKKPTSAGRGVIKRGERFMVGKESGGQILFLGLAPMPHWASSGFFTWTGTYTQAKRLLREVGGGLYPVKPRA